MNIDRDQCEAQRSACPWIHPRFLPSTPLISSFHLPSLWDSAMLRYVVSHLSPFKAAISHVSIFLAILSKNVYISHHVWPQFATHFPPPFSLSKGPNIQYVRYTCFTYYTLPSVLLRTGFSSLFVLPHLRDGLVSSSVWPLPTMFAHPSTCSLHIRCVHPTVFTFVFDVLLLVSARKRPLLLVFRVRTAESSEDLPQLFSDMLSRWLDIGVCGLSIELNIEFPRSIEFPRQSSIEPARLNASELSNHACLFTLEFRA
jgi:hypothetical protein